MNYRVFENVGDITPLVEKRDGVHYIHGNKVLRRDYARKQYMSILVNAAKQARVQAIPGRLRLR